MLVRLSVLLRNKRGCLYAITKLNNYSGALRDRKNRSKYVQIFNTLRHNGLAESIGKQKVN